MTESQRDEAEDDLLVPVHSGAMRSRGEDTHRGEYPNAEDKCDTHESNSRKRPRPANSCRRVPPSAYRPSPSASGRLAQPRSGEASASVFASSELKRRRFGIDRSPNQDFTPWQAGSVCF